MGFFSPFVSRSSTASSAVFAAHRSRSVGLLSAFAGTMPALTEKYPTRTRTTSVTIMPPTKLMIDFIVSDVFPQSYRLRPTKKITNDRSHISCPEHWVDLPNPDVDKVNFELRLVFHTRPNLSGVQHLGSSRPSV